MNQRSAAGTGKMGKAPTIYDVSRIAGVSTTTISRVLNKPEMVNPDTRELVEQTIKATWQIGRASCRERV